MTIKYFFQLNSLYIPPPMNFDDKQYLMSQQSPSWMSSKQLSLDTPEWASRDEIDNFIQQTRLMQEHNVPVAFDKSPMKTPMTPGFGPTPFYGTPQHQITTVITPKVGEKKLLII
jgi:hypothetical protein